MKQILVIVIVITSFAGTFAQTTETKKTETSTVKSETKYCCPQCDFCSSKVGTCPHHKVPLVESETEIKYCCSHCDWTVAPVKGKCPQTTASLWKEGVLYCVHYMDKGGKCSKCGMEMEKIEIKKRKEKEK